MPNRFGRNVDRFVGRMSDAEKQRCLDKLDDRFDEKTFENLRGKEREKTVTELQLIMLANKATDLFRERYGLGNLGVPAHNIHVIRENDWPENEKGSAFYESTCQAVVVREQQASIVFFKKILHEMLHFKSYNALQITDSDDSEVREYRLGLVVNTRDGITKYFKNLNEAVTEELAKSLVEEFQDHPLLQAEVAQTREVASRYRHARSSSGEPFFDLDTFYASLADETTLQDHIDRIHGKERSRGLVGEQFGYVQERNILRDLVIKIFKRNRDTFRRSNEVFDLFIKSMMTGNILPLGRLIDETFGKGTLRTIGELDSDVEQQAEFVESL